MTSCSIQDCPGEYERRTVTHTVRHQGQLVVIDSVPAQVCTVCGDVLLDAKTVRRLEELLDTRATPARTAPVYGYADRIGAEC